MEKFNDGDTRSGDDFDDTTSEVSISDAKALSSLIPHIYQRTHATLEVIAHFAKLIDSLELFVN